MQDMKKGISRAELFAAAGGMGKADACIQAAYDAWLEEDWKKGRGNPHGHPWHTSFHGSSFPASAKSCPRKMLYTMMDIPQPEPFSAFGMALMDAGKDVETRIVEKLYWHGTLISAGPDAAFQSGFADPEYWLTGSIDAVILPPGFNSPYPVEIKSKEEEALRKIKSGEYEVDENHRNQLYAYMYGLRHHPEQVIPGYKALGLDPVKGGSVLYVSRSKPRNTHEVYFPYDEEAIELALGNLKNLQQFWKDGYLPERPKSWRWTEQPCKHCDFKKLCKKDMKEGIDKIDDSNTVEWAKEHDPSYDLDAKRKAVADRWKNNSQKR